MWLSPCRAYLWASGEYRSQNIWNVVPEYFKKTQREMEEQTNCVQSFLGSDRLVLDEHLYMPYEEFKKQCTAYLRDNNLKPTKYNLDVLAGPFSDKKLSLSAAMECRQYPRVGGSLSRQSRWVDGCDARENLREAAEGTAPAGTPPRCRTASSLPWQASCRARRPA